ncbi:MAG: hypothetical protein ACK4GO_16815 [Gemmobacter sp.]
MRQVDHAFLRSITSAGLAVVRVDPHEVSAVDPETGLTFTLTPGEPIPRRNASSAAETTVASYDDARKFLLDRAADLSLNLGAIEDCAGLTHGHANKISASKRKADFDTMALIAGALGYEVVLRHRGLPPITLSAIAAAAPTSARRRLRRPAEVAA